jgi:DNA invertase Pin-like site-specific DNA recombinase
MSLSTTFGWLMFQIIGAMAEFERSLIQERFLAGLQSARGKVKLPSRPRWVLDSSRVTVQLLVGAPGRSIARELRFCLPICTG